MTPSHHYLSLGSDSLPEEQSALVSNSFILVHFLHSLLSWALNEHRLHREPSSQKLVGFRATWLVPRDSLLGCPPRRLVWLGNHRKWDVLCLGEVSYFGGGGREVVLDRVTSSTWCAEDLNLSLELRKKRGDVSHEIDKRANAYEILAIHLVFLKTSQPTADCCLPRCHLSFSWSSSFSALIFIDFQGN